MGSLVIRYLVFSFWNVSRDIIHFLRRNILTFLNEKYVFNFLIT